MSKYNPKSRDELAKLVSDESVHLGDIDTSAITNMKDLFKDSNRMDFSGIESWDTSSVKTFVSAFENAKHFNSDISSWNVSSATNFAKMFWNATAFDQPIGAHWDTSNATSMIYMFCQAKRFNNGGQRFGEKWKMNKVKWTWRMFWGAENFNQPLNHWNVANVENMQRMFMNAKAFNQPLDSWNVANVKNMEEMFNGAESFNQDLSAWGDKLSKAQNMRRMFANTKMLAIDFLGAWTIPQNCLIEHIKKGSKLESHKKDDIKVVATNDTTKESVFNECEIRQIQASEKDKIQRLNLKENKDFVGKWIPQNILENDYEVFLAKIKDFDDSEVDESKFSFADLEQGSYEKWDFAFYKVFDYWFLVEKDGKKLNDIQCEGNAFENAFRIEQSTDMESWDKNYKTKACTYDNNLSILFDSQYISILASNVAKAKDILAVINAYILAKAYNTKMQNLGIIARMANEERRKNKENKGRLSWLPSWVNKTKRKNKELYKKLKESYESVCNFDLHSYHNIPVAQNQLDDRSLVEIWQQISKTYMIQDKHDELKETIRQVTQLVSDERQEDLNFIMRWVAGLSAFAAFFSAAPVIKDFVLWIASKF